MSRALRRALLVGLTGLACGHGPAPVAPSGELPADGGASREVQVRSEVDASVREAADRGAAEAQDERIATALEKVTRARGLAALRRVPGAVLPRDTLISKVKAHVDREVPPAAIRNEGLELQLLGFIRPDLDFEAETFKLLEAQLAGFYEEEDGTMYMAADLAAESADATLAHELVHALQDQHFDLKPHSRYEAGRSDEQLAFSALAEGDATSAMADVLIGEARPGATALDLPEAMFVAQVDESVSSGPAASAPHIMRTSLVAPYTYGTTFVNALRRQGGWALVDSAWASLPATTEQILHLDKWRGREPAIQVPAPTVLALGPGWVVVDEDTNGELGLRLAFEEWMGRDQAEKAAGGWGGDRAVLATRGDLAALAIHVRYDDDRPGTHAFVDVARGLSATAGKPAARDGAWICVERPHLGPLAAMRRGRDLVLIAGPARTGGRWSSAGTCSGARRWASEVAAQ